jgi:hypothetical protein
MAVSTNVLVLLPHFLTPYSANGPAFIVGQTESGYAAVKGDLSLPATFNVMDQAFNRSTGIASLSYIFRKLLNIARGDFATRPVTTQFKHLVPRHEDPPGHH